LFDRVIDQDEYGGWPLFVAAPDAETMGTQ